MRRLRSSRRPAARASLRSGESHQTRTWRMPQACRLTAGEGQCPSPESIRISDLVRVIRPEPGEESIRISDLVRVIRPEPGECRKPVGLRQEKGSALLLNPSGFFDVKPPPDPEKGSQGIPGGRSSCQMTSNLSQKRPWLQGRYFAGLKTTEFHSFSKIA